MHQGQRNYPKYTNYNTNRAPGYFEPKPRGARVPESRYDRDNSANRRDPSQYQRYNEPSYRQQGGFDYNRQRYSRPPQQPYYDRRQNYQGSNTDSRGHQYQTARDQRPKADRYDQQAKTDKFSSYNRMRQQHKYTTGLAMRPSQKPSYYSFSTAQQFQSGLGPSVGLKQTQPVDFQSIASKYAKNQGQAVVVDPDRMKDTTEVKNIYGEKLDLPKNPLLEKFKDYSIVCRTVPLTY